MNATFFECPDCGAQYKVVRQEADQTQLHSSNPKQLKCLTCGRPLDSCDGKFVLKYFRVKASRGAPQHFAPAQQEAQSG